jgi:nicotinamide mononucleotide adenylyltransferase
MTKKYQTATVHGRFQPPHLDHFEYIEAGLKFSNHLIIGITQATIDLLNECPEDPHRSEAPANPFTFNERCELITAMLLAEGYLKEQFSFIPFPIELPEILERSISKDIPCLTTIRDQWNIVKIERLRSLGYVVEVLWDRQGQTGIQGTIIREKVQNEDESWKNQLHPAVVEILLRTNLISKMKLRE